MVGGTPYNGLLGDSGTFFRYQVYEKVGNSRGSLIDKMFRKDSRYGYTFSERSNSTV